MRFKLRLQRLEDRLSIRDLPSLAVVDDSGKLVKALVGTVWLTGDEAARSVILARQKGVPLKIYLFDPEPPFSQGESPQVADRCE